MKPSSIDAAPAAPLGWSTSSPTTGGGPPEPPPSPALLACCALAGWGNPLSGLDAQTDYIARTLSTVLASYPPEAVLRWRERDVLSPESWYLRWRWALTTLRQHMPGIVGISELPESPDDANLPGPFPMP